MIRTLQKHFNPSDTFKPWLEAERERRNRESGFQRTRRRHQRLEVKIGHGGTLDPLATGVLITGIGKGTKSLQDFLACTKSYETISISNTSTGRCLISTGGSLPSRAYSYSFFPLTRSAE